MSTPGRRSPAGGTSRCGRMRTAASLPAAAGFEPFVERVTLSLPTLRSAGEILFVVAGDAKADAARRAFVEEPGPETPASLVRAADGRTTAILDRAAAAGIRG